MISPVKPQFSAEFTNVWDEQAVTWDVKGSSVTRGLDIAVSTYYYHQFSAAHARMEKCDG